MTLRLIILLLLIFPVCSTADSSRVELTIFSINISGIRFHSFFDEKYVVNNYTTKIVLKEKQDIERIINITSGLNSIEFDESNPITRGDNSYIVVKNSTGKTIMISDGCYLIDVQQKKVYEATPLVLRYLVPYKNKLAKKTCLLLKNLRLRDTNVDTHKK